VDSEVVACKAPGRYRSLYRTNSPAVSGLKTLQTLRVDALHTHPEKAVNKSRHSWFYTYSQRPLMSHMAHSTMPSRHINCPIIHWK
jgi:hypothetical protein